MPYIQTTHTHTHTHTHSHSLTHSLTHITHTHARTHACSLARTHARTHARAHALLDLHQGSSLTASPALHGPHVPHLPSFPAAQQEPVVISTDTLWYLVLRETETERDRDRQTETERERERRPLIILDLPNLKICTVEKIQRRYPARGRA